MKKLVEKLDCSWTEDSEWIFVSAPKEIKSILFYLQEAGKFSTYPPYSTQREGLNSFLILLTLRGTGILEYDKRTYELKENSVFFINCDEKHRYFASGKENWEFLFIHFNGPTVQGIFNYFMQQNRSPIVHTRTNAVGDLLSDLLSLNRTYSAQNDLLSFRLISELLSELLLSGQSVAHSVNTTPQLMLDILAYVDKRFCEDVSLEILARKFSLDKFVLCRKFKSCFGIGLKDYVLNKKLAYAKELLQFTDASVSDISEELGYSDVNYFIALFKKREQTTPLAYRKQRRN